MIMIKTKKGRRGHQSTMRGVYFFDVFQKKRSWCRLFVFFFLRVQDVFSWWWMYGFCFTALFPFSLQYPFSFLFSFWWLVRGGFLFWRFPRQSALSNLRARDKPAVDGVFYLCGAYRSFSHFYHHSISSRRRLLFLLFFSMPLPLLWWPTYTNHCRKPRHIFFRDNKEESRERERVTIFLCLVHVYTTVLIICFVVFVFVLFEVSSVCF